MFERIHGKVYLDGRDVPQYSLIQKQQVMTELYRRCKERGILQFNDDEVRAVCGSMRFDAPYDVARWDSAAHLPPALVEDDVFVVPLGRGWHEFVQGIGVGYHRFEAIPEREMISWPFSRSALYTVTTGVRNIPYEAYNQRIISDFVCGYLGETPRFHFAHEGYILLHYSVGKKQVFAHGLPVKIDFTVEHQGVVTVFAFRNGFSKDFNVVQLFNQVRFYAGLQQTHGLNIQGVQGCFVLRRDDCFRLYLYTFDDLSRPATIRLLRNTEYTLDVERSLALAASQAQ